MASDELLRNRKTVKSQHEQTDEIHATTQNHQPPEAENERTRAQELQGEIVHEMTITKSTYYLTRIVLVRYLAFIYGILFILVVAITEHMNRIDLQFFI